MYDAATNTLSWLAVLFALVACSMVLFTYERTYLYSGGTIAYTLLVFAVVRTILESKVTSAQITKVSRSRCVLAIVLGLAATLLIATSNPESPERVKYEASKLMVS